MSFPESGSMINIASDAVRTIADTANSKRLKVCHHPAVDVDAQLGRWTVTMSARSHAALAIAAQRI